MCLRLLLFFAIFLTGCPDHELGDRGEPAENSVDVDADAESFTDVLADAPRADEVEPPLGSSEQADTSTADDEGSIDAIMSREEDTNDIQSRSADGLSEAIENDIESAGGPGDDVERINDEDDSGGIVVVGDGGSGPIFGPSDANSGGGATPEDDGVSAGPSEDALVSDDASSMVDGIGDTDVTPEPISGCEPNPCVQGSTPSCASGVAEADFTPGTCQGGAQGAPTCMYETQRMDCVAAGGSCAAGVCTGAPSAPDEGELVITEVMRNPLPNTRQWIELLVNAEVPVNLAGCGLRDGKGGIIIFPKEPVIAQPGDLVLVAEDQPSNDGLPMPDITFPQGTLDLLASDEELVLNCMGTVVDVIDYPSASLVVPFPSDAGQSMQVSPQNYAAEANDTADKWCSAEDPYTFGSYGTPGQLNPACNADIDRCKLWYPAFSSAKVGEVIEVLATVFDEGVTDVTVNAPDPLPEFLAEVGIGPDGVNPELSPTQFDWFNAVPNYEPPASVPTYDDMYGGWVIPETVGTHDIAARFSPDAGVTWVYCDLDGSDNGYQLPKAGHALIQP